MDTIAVVFDVVQVDAGAGGAGGRACAGGGGGGGDVMGNA